MMEQRYLRRRAVNHLLQEDIFCVENLPDEMMSRRRAVMNVIMHLISGVE